MKNGRLAKLCCAAVVLVAALSTSVALASKVCWRTPDGCTVCQFYGPNGEDQGYIEWCF